MTTKTIAPCGLDCAACDIYRAPQCPEVAQGVVDWLRDERGIECGTDTIRCGTCRGDRAACWSEDCEIRACCVDDRKLQSCHQCAEMPCERLTTWARQGEHHAMALERLQAMKGAQCSDESGTRSGAC
jgi:hypothetical protein